MDDYFISPSVFENIDILAIHLYPSSPFYESWVTFYSDISGTWSDNTSTAMLPVYVTEAGTLVGTADTDPLNRLPAHERFRFVNRVLLSCALAGFKGYYAYSYNSHLFGDLLGDTDGFIAGINWFQAHVAGKTILSASYRRLDGRITITTSEGTFQI